MGTKNISLPDELEAYVDAKVASGEYAHASEVVREGLRLLRQQEAEKFEWLKREIQKGLDSPIRDDLKTEEDVLREVRRGGEALLAKRRNKHAQTP